MIILTELSNIVVDISKSLTSPINELITYGFPLVTAWRSEYGEITDKEDDGKTYLSHSARKKILEEIKNLGEMLGIQRNVTPYYSLGEKFRHLGGGWSFSRPIIHIPLSYLQRNEEFGTFGQEKNKEALEKEKHFFTDLETKFLITKELVGIKQNTSLFKTAARVLMFVAIILFITAPILGLSIGFPIFTFAVIFSFIVERGTQETSDALAIEALSQKIPPKEVTKAALSALKKHRDHNLSTYQKKRFAKIWITKEGNKRWIFSSPSLTERIKRIEKLERSLKEKEIQTTNPPLKGDHKDVH